jgi:hypothetical protein
MWDIDESLSFAQFRLEEKLAISCIIHNTHVASGATRSALPAHVPRRRDSFAALRLEEEIDEGLLVDFRLACSGVMAHLFANATPVDFPSFWLSF